MTFIGRMLSDENGVPDEANLVFVGAAIILAIGAFMVAYGHPFPLGDFAAAICALIPLYRAARGDWHGEKPNPPLLQKDQTQ